MLTPLQRRRLIFEIDQSDNTSTETRVLANYAMNVVENHSDRMASLLKIEGWNLNHERPFAAMLKPVGDLCNLNCKYCFNQPAKSPAIMNEETLEIIIMQVLETFPEGASFIFHGGEPLLAGVDFYKKALGLQEKYRNPGQYIRNSIQTNGTLLNKEWGEFFKQHNIEVSTSIDGPPDTHNLNRIDKSGNGTFPRTIEGIQTIESCGINAGAIAVVTCPPSISPQEFFDFITSLKIRRWKVNPCSTPQAKNCYANYIEGLFNAWVRSNQDLNISIFLDILQVSLGFSPSDCVRAGTCSSFIGFEPDGSVKPCCEFSMDPKFYFGNILHKSLDEILNGFLAKSFWEKRKEGDEMCAGCLWWEMCHGGCTYHRIQAGGTPSARDYLCETYSTTFERLTLNIDKILLGN